MTSQSAVRWAGVAAVIAATLIPFGALGRLLPDPLLALAVTVGNVGLVFLIFAFMGIGRVLADEIGAPGVIVVIAATVGAVLLVADGVIRAYVYPAVAEESVAKLQGTLALRLVSTLGPLALLLAILLLLFINRPAQALPGRPAWIMLTGVLLTLLSGTVAVTTIAGLLAVSASLILAAGLAWIGVRLLS